MLDPANSLMVNVWITFRAAATLKVADSMIETLIIDMDTSISKTLLENVYSWWHLTFTSAAS